MDELKQRMLSQAIVGEGDMIRVDMFLNHCMDMDLMERLGSALAKRFKGEKITKVLTAESSGIALACFTARALGVPVVYAKKFQTGYIDPEVYTAEIHSFSLAAKSGGEVAGVGVAIEKAMRDGGQVLRRMDLRVEALVTVEQVTDGQMVLS